MPYSDQNEHLLTPAQIAREAWVYYKTLRRPEWTEEQNVQALVRAAVGPLHEQNGRLKSWLNEIRAMAYRDSSDLAGRIIRLLEGPVEEDG